MASPTEATVQSLRISAADLKARLDAGEPVTIVDVRNEKAWAASQEKIRGAVRADASAFKPDKAWPSDRLTVTY